MDAPAETPLLRRIRESVIGDDQVVPGPEPPLRLTDVHYDADGLLRYPRHAERAPDSELPRYLADARACFAAAGAGPGGGPGDLVSADFEHLRWFELPAACLA